MKLVIATRNPYKVKEIKAILSVPDLEFLYLPDLSKDIFLQETGTTFLQNAEQKARLVATSVNGLVLADDSGLEVDALRGEPGVFSARYAGSNATDIQNINKLLSALADIPWEKRQAHYRCVIALIDFKKQLYISEGVCDGIITYKPLGEHGFGYDPVFYVPEYKLTMAQLSFDIKNKISHRAFALQKTKIILNRLLIGQ